MGLNELADMIERDQSKYFAVLDLTGAYYSLPLEESSRDFTAFSTPLGQMTFNCVPQGLTNSPACLNRLPAYVRQVGRTAKDGLSWIFTLYHDVIVTAPIVELLAERLADVLREYDDQDLQACGLNMLKCHSWYISQELATLALFLQRLSADDKALLTWPQPRNGTTGRVPPPQLLKYKYYPAIGPPQVLKRSCGDGY